MYDSSRLCEIMPKVAMSSHTEVMCVHGRKPLDVGTDRPDAYKREGNPLPVLSCSLSVESEETHASGHGSLYLASLQHTNSMSSDTSVSEVLILRQVWKPI